MSYETSSGDPHSGEGFLVKECASFPIPLDGMMKRWADDGTLRQRLMAVLALAVEAQTGYAVHYNSSMQLEMSKFIHAILNIPHKEIAR